MGKKKRVVRKNSATLRLSFKTHPPKKKRPPPAVSMGTPAAKKRKRPARPESVGRKSVDEAAAAAAKALKVATAAVKSVRSEVRMERCFCLGRHAGARSEPWTRQRGRGGRPAGGDAAGFVC